MCVRPSTSVASRLPLGDADIRYWPDFLSISEADDSLHTLTTQCRWRQESITLFGTTHLQPRLIAWHGDPEKTYRYSSLTLRPEPWTPSILVLRHLLREQLNIDFNSVLLNLYRDGQDSMGWHSDDEPELGSEPIIASLSLGATRKFRLRHKKLHEFYSLDLSHGSLLLMAGLTQRYWRHSVPKTAKLIGPRINLTFRVIN